MSLWGRDWDVEGDVQAPLDLKAWCEGCGQPYVMTAAASRHKLAVRKFECEACAEKRGANWGGEVKRPEGDTTDGTSSTDEMPELVRLKGLMEAEEDVRRVVRLARVSEHSALYCIETPYESFPRYVVGLASLDNEVVEILLKCGLESSALAEYEVLLAQYGVGKAEPEAGTAAADAEKPD